MEMEETMLEEGMQAPDFTLGADDGSEVTLSSFRGSPYFKVEH